MDPIHLSPLLSYSSLHFKNIFPLSISNLSKGATVLLAYILVIFFLAGSE